MQTAVHHPVQVQIEQAFFADGTPVPDIFTVGLVHEPEGAAQTYYGVYVPKALQPAMFANDVLCLQVEGLSGARSRALPLGPEFLVFGLKTRAGQTIFESPKPLRKALWAMTIVGGGATVVGILLLVAESSIAGVGAVMLVAGTHMLRSAEQLVLVPVLEQFKRMSTKISDTERPSE